MMEEEDMSSNTIITFIRSEKNIAEVEYKIIDTYRNTIHSYRGYMPLEDFIREFNMVPLFPETKENKTSSSQEVI